MRQNRIFDDTCAFEERYAFFLCTLSRHGHKTQNEDESQPPPAWLAQ